jgi:hypothetical protein
MGKNDRTPEEAGMRLFHLVREKDKTGQMTEVKKYYKRPKTPSWNPIYSVFRQKIPASWSSFLHEKIDELYWEGELES